MIFTSDNAAGVHPEVLEAIAAANEGRAIAYGGDVHTERALARVKEHFGEAAEALFVWGGTAANVLALASVLERWEAVLCAEGAHVAGDECGAPERFLGCKLLLIPTTHGKLTPDAVAARIRGEGVVHHAQPRVLSVSQPTEVGTVYTAAELRALAEFCRARDLVFHVDGARLPSAAVHLGVDLRAITTDVGADLVSLGGTKSGLLGAEAVLFLRPGLARGAAYQRKQAMQLASKMRFVAAQMDALLSRDLWRRVATHASAMAQRLAAGLRGVDAIELAHPVQTNAVFARLPRAAFDALQREGFRFAEWEPHPERPLARWMTCFDTSEREVDDFVAAIRRHA
ncbi:MAG: beta-eliminating lyase-related protein [Myxococcota bacterium]|nr:beta-eliminating lyase-related protein [Myxococcota bacterium]